MRSEPPVKPCFRVHELIRSGDDDAPALMSIEHEFALTYAELAESVERVAQQLQSFQLPQGSTVAVALPNGIEAIIAFLALTRAGLCALFVNPTLSKEELGYCLDNSGAAACIVLNEASAAFSIATHLTAAVLCTELQDRRVNVRQPRTAARVRAQQGSTLSAKSAQAITNNCLLMYTSGTTSRPKGVPLTHANIIASVGNFAQCFQLCRSDRALLVMPLFHIHGLVGVTLSTLATGGSVIVAPSFSASQFWSWARQYGATWYSASPTIHRILLKRANEDCAPGLLRFIRSSSAPLAVGEITMMEQTFQTQVVEAYGMTEAANQISCNPINPGKRKPGTVGVAAGVAIAIQGDDGETMPPGKEGEICIQGPHVMAQYLNNPAANAESFRSGWFRTGDLGVMDDENYLRIVGRLKELINRGGEKVSPAEVEHVLNSCDLVDDAACFSLPHAMYGQEVYAAIVAHKASVAIPGSHGSFTAGENEPEGSYATSDNAIMEETGLSEEVIEAIVLEHCRKQLAPFKVPKKIYFTDTIPRNATNKVQRSLIAGMFKDPQT